MASRSSIANSKAIKTGTKGLPINSRYTTTHSTQTKALSKSASPPRMQYHQLYTSQPRSSSISSISSNKQQKYNSTASSSSISSYMPSHHASIPTGTTAPTTKHGHSLSSSCTISYPHPSIHPPLRLLTTATCLDTLTCLVSAQSPPHSPTFTAVGLPKSTTSGGGSSSRASSILDGILGGALGSSSPPTSSGTMKSSYSAAQESLADFSIAASKRSISASSTSNSVASYNQQDNKTDCQMGGVIRSRSNYVSFPNFDDIDFVDVTMVEDREEDDDEADWSGPDSPPEGQRPSIMEEKMMRPIDSRSSFGMPTTTPSQHWLLQLENYHELHVNGVQV